MPSLNLPITNINPSAVQRYLAARKVINRALIYGSKGLNARQISQLARDNPAAIEALLDALSRFEARVGRQP